MALLDFLKTKNDASQTAPMAPIMPEAIYKQGVLELQDVIAPSALKITPRELNLGGDGQAGFGDEKQIEQPSFWQVDLPGHERKRLIARRDEEVRLRRNNRFQLVL